MLGLRRKLLWAILVVLIFNVATSWRVEIGYAQTPPKISVDPPAIKDSSKGIGDTFTVDIWIYNASSLGNWQINMTFNQAVVNVTQVVEGWFLSDWYPTTGVLRVINNDLGYVQASCAIGTLPYPDTGVDGDGLLCTITFTIKATDRGTLLQFVKGTKLNKLVNGQPSPVTIYSTEDGSFDNRPIGDNAPPVAHFDVEPLNASKRGEVRFDASGSTDSDAWLVSYGWDYGDGTKEIYMREPHGIGNLTATATHVFSRSGTYTVNLTVTDNDGKPAFANVEIPVLYDIAIVNVESPYVVAVPGIPITVDVAVANNGDFYETFNVTAYYNQTMIERKQITNMAPNTQQILTYNWDTTELEFGKYTLKANATLLDEETNTSNNEYIDGSVTMASSNIVDFQLLVGGVTFHVITDSPSTISDLSFSSGDRKIDFQLTGEQGTGGFCNITIPNELLGGNHTVLFNGVPVTPDPHEATNGTHVFLYFAYTHGTVDTVEIIGETAATPPVAVIIASKTNPLVGELVTFDASSSYDPDGTIISWSWNFGDGNTATEEIVPHSYSPFGIYTVTLTVWDNETYMDSTEILIRAIDYPRAEFSFSPTDPLVNQTVTLDATNSQANGGSITNYKWSFGDGQTGVGSSATHAYSTTSTFTVTLTVTDSESLENSTTQEITVTIHNIAITDITTSSSSVEKGQTITIQITSSNKGNYTETFTVTVYSNATAIETKSVTDLGPSDSQQVTMSWSTANIAPGTYVLKAEASTVEGETKADDNSRTYGSVSINKVISSVSVSASSTTITLGKNTIIHGVLEPSKAGASITVRYRLLGEEWAALATVISDAQAQYILNWKPKESGTYEVQASWQGDAETQPCQSETETIIVEEGGALSSERMLIYGGIIAAILALALLAVYLIRLRKK